MKNHFFITGLPRSRTAWLANLLTYGNSFCYHDAMLGLEHIEQLRERIDATPFANVGISDPATLLYWRQLADWYPEAKWVVIFRSRLECEAAAAKAFGEQCDLTDFRYWIVELVTSLQPLVPLVVLFPDVSARSPEIAAHCGVDIGGPERLEQLCRMNIQVDPTWLRRELIKLKANPPQWFKEIEAAA